MLSENEE
jgi:hypothetical protein